jgi:hypothetical protein
VGGGGDFQQSSTKPHINCHRKMGGGGSGGGGAYFISLVICSVPILHSPLNYTLIHFTIFLISRYVQYFTRLESLRMFSFLCAIPRAAIQRRGFILAWIVILSVYGADTIAEVKLLISPFLR